MDDIHGYYPWMVSVDMFHGYDLWQESILILAWQELILASLPGKNHSCQTRTDSSLDYPWVWSMDGVYGCGPWM